MLITSRSPLATLEGTARIALDVFTPTESVQLLEKVVGADRIDGEHRNAIRVAELGDHLPIAVRVCGARLATRAHWPLSRLADRLADPHRVLDELRAGDLDVRERLMPSYTALPPELRDVLRRLAGLGPGSFSASTAADLIELSIMDAADLLDELAAAHLLRPDPLAPDRYRMPELVFALAIGQDVLCNVG